MAAAGQSPAQGGSDVDPEDELNAAMAAGAVIAFDSLQECDDDGDDEVEYEDEYEDEYGHRHGDEASSSDALSTVMEDSEESREGPAATERATVHRSSFRGETTAQICGHHRQSASLPTIIFALASDTVDSVTDGCVRAALGEDPPTPAAPRTSLDEFLELEKVAAEPVRGQQSVATDPDVAGSIANGTRLTALHEWFESLGLHSQANSPYPLRSTGEGSRDSSYAHGFLAQGFESVADLVAAQLTENDLRECGLVDMHPRKVVYHALTAMSAATPSEIGSNDSRASSHGLSAAGAGAVELAELLLGWLRPLVTKLETIVAAARQHSGEEQVLATLRNRITAVEQEQLRALSAELATALADGVKNESGTSSTSIESKYGIGGGGVEDQESHTILPAAVAEEPSVEALKTLTVLSKDVGPWLIQTAERTAPHSRCHEDAWSKLGDNDLNHDCVEDGHGDQGTVADPSIPPQVEQHRAHHHRPVSAPPVRSSAWVGPFSRLGGLSRHSSRGLPSGHHAAVDFSARRRMATAAAASPNEHDAGSCTSSVSAQKMLRSVDGNKKTEAEQTTDFHRKLASRAKIRPRRELYPALTSGDDQKHNKVDVIMPDFSANLLTSTKQQIRAAVNRWRSLNDPHQSPELVLRHFFLQDASSSNHPGRVTEAGLAKLCKIRLDVELSCDQTQILFGHYPTVWFGGQRMMLHGEFCAALFRRRPPDRPYVLSRSGMTAKQPPLRSIGHVEDLNDLSESSIIPVVKRRPSAYAKAG